MRREGEDGRYVLLEGNGDDLDQGGRGARGEEQGVVKAIWVLRPMNGASRACMAAGSKVADESLTRR